MSYGEVGLVLAVEDDNSELTPVNFTGREMLKIAVTGNGGRQQDAMIKYLELLGQNYERSTALPARRSLSCFGKIKRM